MHQGILAILALEAVLLGFAPHSVLAQSTSSRMVPFQARLSNANGSPVSDGAYDVTFQLYDAATGGTALWIENHPSLSVIGGQISVLLGSIVSFDDPNGDSNPADAIGFDAVDGSRFVSIKIGNGAEMVPRHQLVPAFHARTADLATKVPDGAITAIMIAPGAVTSDKILDGSIGPSDLQAAPFITGANISAGSISSAQISDGSIDLADLSPSVQATLAQGATQTALADLSATLNGPWSAETPIQVASQTSGTPVKGTTTTDYISWRRVGSEVLIRFRYRQVTAGTNGTGPYLITVPGGLSIDTSITGLCTSTALAACAQHVVLSTFSGEAGSNNAGIGGRCVMHSATQFKCGAYWGGVTDVFWGQQHSFSNTDIGIGGWLRVPVSGW